MRIIKIILVVAIASILLLPAAARATDTIDQLLTPFYDTNSATCTLTFSGGSLPSSVPQPYNAIFTQAANKYNVAPAFLAALFFAGEHGSSWPTPPPPYGTGSVWASSGIPSPGQPDWPTQPPGPGAAGPFQFEFPTWQIEGIDASGDGVANVEDLQDASFGAANYLAYLGAAGTTDQATLRQAAASYNGSGPNDSYATNVWNAFQSFSAGGNGSSVPTGSCSGGSGSYTNPFPGGWTPNRLDMGYDGTFSGQVVSPFSGTVIYAADSFSNWGGYIEVQANQPVNALPTSTLYFAEGLKPLVPSGQNVNAGDPIANPAPSPYGNAYGTTADGSGQIEWGVAANGSVGSPTDPLAEAQLRAGKCPAYTPESRAMVLNFSQWAQQSFGLGAPSTTSDAGCA